MNIKNHISIYFKGKNRFLFRGERSSHALLGEGCKNLISSFRYAAFTNNF